MSSNDSLDGLTSLRNSLNNGVKLWNKNMEVRAQKAEKAVDYARAELKSMDKKLVRLGTEGAEKEKQCAQLQSEAADKDKKIETLQQELAKALKEKNAAVANMLRIESGGMGKDSTSPSTSNTRPPLKRRKRSSS